MSSLILLFYRAYEIDFTKKKIAIIFNCTEFTDSGRTSKRKGADCDVKNIIESLKQLNFEVGRDIRLHENCTLDQTKKIIYDRKIYLLTN